MIAVIASRAFYDIPNLQVLSSEYIRTPFGDPSDAISTVQVGKGSPFKVLARNGGQGRLLPDDINNLANIWALKQANVSKIIGISSVASLHTTPQLADFLVCDQLIDYTQKRDASFVGRIEDAPCVLSDFSVPFYEPFRQQLVTQLLKVTPNRVHATGVYGCLSGPRRETLAEAKKYRQDGCDCLGFTVMPEAILSQELALAYVSLGLITRYAVSTDAKENKDLPAQINQGLSRLFELW